MKNSSTKCITNIAFRSRIQTGWDKIISIRKNCEIINSILLRQCTAKLLTNMHSMYTVLTITQILMMTGH